MLRALAVLVLATSLACGPVRDEDQGSKVAVDRSALRPTDTSSALPYRYTAGETVEGYGAPDSGFLIHFTRTGVNAVPLLDADDSGTPDIVETVNAVYDAVAKKYANELGFKAPLGDAALPDNGGDGRFDIYLLDFGVAADGNFAVDQCPPPLTDACAGYIQQENDFVGFGYPSVAVGTTVLGSHEYFHAVQNAYDAKQGVVIEEGTAVWAEKQFDPVATRDDFNGFIGGYMQNVDRSLDTPPAGPASAFAYGSAIFFELLSEKYGPAVIREMWEQCENGHGDPLLPDDVADPHWLRQLDQALLHKHGSSFAEAFRTFATWNLYLGASADLTQSYSDCAAYPLPPFTPEDAPFNNGNAPLRVFYASTQYYAVPSSGRAQMTAILVDDPSSPQDDTADMALVLAPRLGTKVGAPTVPMNVQTSAPLIDVSDGSSLLVAVVNTAHEGANGVLSRRPFICVGSAGEILECREALNPTFDAGQPPSVMIPEVPDPLGPTAPKQGCSATGQGGALMCVLLLALKALAGRRSRAML